MKQEMLKKAIEIRKHAYAKYSNFKVGACLLTNNNNIYVGCNVENAAYPQGSCAEQAAILSMVGDGDLSGIKEIVIVGKGNALTTPCGGCRQKIREFGNKDTVIHVGNTEKILKSYTLNDLLPDSFGPENLS